MKKSNSPFKNTQKLGTLHVITGPMFSGKTTELLNRLYKYSLCGLKVLYVNSALDNRSFENFSTCNPFLKLCDEISYIKTKTLQERLQDIENYDIIGIDEAQFFSDLCVCVLHLAENKGKVVIVAGLGSTAKREIFGQIIALEPFCDTYEKITAICKVCSKKDGQFQVPAIFTKKIVQDDTIIDVGGTEKYISVCRKHFIE